MKESKKWLSIYEEKKRHLKSKCQAPVHQPGCNGHKTVDHLTPRCLAKVFSWTPEQTNSLDNLQVLSDECHQAKDADTPLRLEVIRRQLKGEMFGLEKHLTTFLGNDAKEVLRLRKSGIPITLEGYQSMKEGQMYPLPRKVS